MVRAVRDSRIPGVWLATAWSMNAAALLPSASWIGLLDGFT